MGQVQERRALKTRKKNQGQTASTGKTAAEAHDDPVKILTAKVRAPIEIEEPETAVPLEEKGHADIVGAVEETEEVESDEPSLDDEDLNPFGDRWEQ